MARLFCFSTAFLILQDLIYSRQELLLSNVCADKDKMYIQALCAVTCPCLVLCVFVVVESDLRFVIFLNNNNVVMMSDISHVTPKLTNVFAKFGLK